MQGLGSKSTSAGTKKRGIRGVDEDSELKDGAQKHGGKSWGGDCHPDVSVESPPAANYDSDDKCRSQDRYTTECWGYPTNRHWTQEEDAKLTSMRNPQEVVAQGVQDRLLQLPRFRFQVERLFRVRSRWLMS
jgi:hypothetical protein